MEGSNSESYRLECIAELRGHEERVWHVAWNPVKPLLATCSADKTVRIYVYKRSAETVEFIHIHTLSTGHSRTIRALAWNPQGTTLACGSFDSTVSIWEKDSEGPEGWECVSTLEGPESEIKGLSYSSGGNLLATCSRDKSVWIWEVLPDNEHETVSVLMGQHTQDVKCVCWHPFEEILASGSYDNSIKLYLDDPSDDWYDFTTLEGHTSTVWSLMFSPSGLYLASASDDQTIRLWSPISQQEYQGTWHCMYTLQGHSRSIFSVSWGKGGDLSGCAELLASTGSDGKINIWRIPILNSEAVNLRGPTLIASISQSHGFYDTNTISFCPHVGYEMCLASGGDDGAVKIWRIVSDRT